MGKSKIDAERDKRKQKTSGCSGPTLIASVLWTLVGLSFLYVVSQMYNKRAARGSKTSGSSVVSEAADEPVVEAKPARTLRMINPKFGNHESLKDNKLMDLTEITWDDIDNASEDDLNQVIALWTFVDIEKKPCDVGWIPKGIPDKDGSWPVCKEVAAKPQGGQDKCLVYSVGIGGLPEFDIAAEAEKGCKVRSFDPTIERPNAMPASIAFNKIGLSGEDDLTNSNMPVGTLKKLMELNKEAGQHAYIVKVDCEGCEWDAFAQLLQDEGPMALANYDHVLIEVHMGWLKYTPQKAVAMIALLHNAGLGMYWKHFNPWSITSGDTTKLLDTVRTVYGDDMAEQYRASEQTFLRLGREFGTYKEEYKEFWQHHVRPDHMMCCWEFAFWNPASSTKKK